MQSSIAGDGRLPDFNAECFATQQSNEQVQEEQRWGDFAATAKKSETHAGTNECFTFLDETEERCRRHVFVLTVFDASGSFGRCSFGKKRNSWC